MDRGPYQENAKELKRQRTYGPHYGPQNVNSKFFSNFSHFSCPVISTNLTKNPMPMIAIITISMMTSIIKLGVDFFMCLKFCKILYINYLKIRFC